MFLTLWNCVYKSTQHIELIERCEYFFLNFFFKSFKKKFKALIINNLITL